MLVASVHTWNNKWTNGEKYMYFSIKAYQRYTYMSFESWLIVNDQQIIFQYLSRLHFEKDFVNIQSISYHYLLTNLAY